MSSTRVHDPFRTYTHNLVECTSGTARIPYGCYKYDTAKNYLPGGLFHFVSGSNSYVPTLHGLTAESIAKLKQVAVCTARSPISNRPFLNHPESHEVELINTGYETLKQGDRFTVQLPNQLDVDAQRQVNKDAEYSELDNKAIWGGLLATRKVHCEYGGDAVEEVLHAIKHDENFDACQLITPYLPQCISSVMTLLANGGDYDTIPQVIRTNAAQAEGGNGTQDVVCAILEDKSVKTYLKTVLLHAMNIMESVQGFSAGQVIRSCNGYNYSAIKTGDRFKAKLNVNRWLS